MADWGGGLGGSGFACRLCEFVTLTKDSLVTHAGYKHALFVQFMPENIQKDFLEVAKSCGENTDSWDLGNNTENGKEEKEKEENEKEEEEKTVFDNQLTLPSQMTNINCSLETPSPTKCLECDFQVSLSQLNYRLFFAFESFSFLQFFRVFFSNVCDFFRVFIFFIHFKFCGFFSSIFAIIVFTQFCSFSNYCDYRVFFSLLRFLFDGFFICFLFSKNHIFIFFALFHDFLVLYDIVLLCDFRIFNNSRF